MPLIYFDLINPHTALLCNKTSSVIPGVLCTNVHLQKPMTLSAQSSYATYTIKYTRHRSTVFIDQPLPNML